MRTARTCWNIACAVLSLAAPASALGRGGSHPSGAEPPSPGIARVEPGSGPATGGTKIMITGFNLAPGATVTLGGAVATEVEAVGLGKLVAVTAPHAPGRVTVSVTNPDGRSGSLGWGYRYLAPQP